MTTSTARPTSVCVYDGTTAVTVQTGLDGHRYGLCADCQGSTNTVTEIMEGFRTAMRNADQLTELVEEFIDKVIVIASATKNPRGTINAVFEMLARERGEATS